MNKSTYLSEPALVSCLGEGASQHCAALFAESNTIYLTPSEDWVSGKKLWLGAVNTPLREFTDDLPAHFNSRNNRLLWHALAQIEPLIAKVISRYSLDRVAVVLGTSTSGSEENISAFSAYLTHQDWSNSGFSQAKQLMSSPADFVRKVYGLRNVAYTVSTACTSGSRALISAARLLELDLCDAVICGGVDTLSHLTVNGFNALEVLSAQRCQPFMADRDGINIGEAAAVFVATREPLESVDPICLLGSGVSSDAYHMSSPRPDAQGAKRAIRDALHAAKLKPQEISWVNLHGTGTQQNDAMEALAIADIFGSKIPCTSTKTLTGHTLGAAGALEAAFLWLTISDAYNSRGQLPAHQSEGQFDTECAPIHLTENDEYYPSTARRLALSTSFAFGGNNTALIIGQTT